MLENSWKSEARYWRNRNINCNYTYSPSSKFRVSSVFRGTHFQPTMSMHNTKTNYTSRSTLKKKQPNGLERTLSWRSQRNLIPWGREVSSVHCIASSTRSAGWPAPNGKSLPPALPAPECVAESAVLGGGDETCERYDITIRCSSPLPGLPV